MSRLPAAPDQVQQSAEQPPPAPPRTTRRAPAAAVLTSLVLVVAVGYGLLQVLPGMWPEAAAAPGSWSSRASASADPVVDSHGVSWPAATDALTGGDTVPVEQVSPGTASPQLYATARQGARSWTVSVPAPGFYAVDLLVAQPDASAAPGTDVFDVLAADGDGAADPLQSGVDLLADSPLPQHVTGVRELTSGELVLSFRAVSGEPAVTGLVVTSMGPDRPQTLMDEDFDGAVGAAAPTPWAPVTGPGPFGEGELEGYSDDPQHVSLDGAGHLVLRATRERYPQPYQAADVGDVYQPWTSGRLETKGQFTVTYGTVAVTAQVPAGQGLWPAFWMLGADIDANPWPVAGEIDVMEHLGQDADRVYSSVRAQSDDQETPDAEGRRASRLGASWTSPVPLTEGQHTYSAELTPGYVAFSVDGRPAQTVAQFDLRSGQQWPLGKPYYLLLNLAVGGTFPGAPDRTTPAEAQLVVDSARVEGWR